MTTESVRRALLADAERACDELLAAADSDAADTLAAAQRQAEALLAKAAEDGRAEARAAAAAEMARARRAAREIVLSARRAAYDEALAAARVASAALQEDTRYPALLAALTALAHGQLGEAAEVSVDARDGGLEARAGSRSVDYRLPVMAERCFVAAGPAVDVLWR